MQGGRRLACLWRSFGAPFVYNPAGPASLALRPEYTTLTHLRDAFIADRSHGGVQGGRARRSTGARLSRPPYCAGPLLDIPAWRREHFPALASGEERLCHLPPAAQLNSHGPARALHASGGAVLAANPQPATLVPDPSAVAAPVLEPLSLKAQVTFDTCWKRLESKYRHFICPREVVWLNGAPGAGKGTNVSFIMKSRGLSRMVGMSTMLSGSSDIKSMIDKGELVPDAMVLDALLDSVLNPELNDGSGLGELRTLGISVAWCVLPSGPT
jgi:hypothetical protein